MTAKPQPDAPGRPRRRADGVSATAAGPRVAAGASPAQPADASSAALKELRRTALRLLAGREFTRASLRERLLRPPRRPASRRPGPRDADANPVDGRDPEVRDPEVRDPEVRDPEVRDPEVQEADLHAAGAPRARSHAIDAGTGADVGTGADADTGAPAGAGASFSRSSEMRRTVDADLVDRLLDELQQAGWLSDARYAEQLVRASAGRHGPARIRQTLLRQGVPAELAEQSLAAMQTDPFTVAQALWQRRFGQPPADARDSARQSRFLLQRGFSPDVIRRVLRAAPSDPS